MFAGYNIVRTSNRYLVSNSQIPYHIYYTEHQKFSNERSDRGASINLSQGIEREKRKKKRNRKLRRTYKQRKRETEKKKSEHIIISLHDDITLLSHFFPHDAKRYSTPMKHSSQKKYDIFLSHIYCCFFSHNNTSSSSQSSQ